ncbi:MAG TPA: isochorismatase family protein [Coriobacteriia bacterium]|nr:isochorismatase family protein [Coriobacteriia bacterium]
MERRAKLVSRSEMVLVIIDVQERLAAAMTRREEVVLACGRLARAAAMLGVPIIVTRQYPQGLGLTVAVLEETLSDLRADGADVTQVDKTAFCCADESHFSEALASTGRTQVVICGMETHICVAQTALVLASEGLDVHVPADACCSRLDPAHEVALARMRASGITVTWTESVMYEAVGRAGTDEFRQLLTIVKG